MSDALEERSAVTQPTMVKEGRERLGRVVSALDVELEAALDSFASWWQAASANRSAGCYRPVASGESDLSPR